MIERLRGRAGANQRERRLRAHPICTECFKRGFVIATDQIDHVVPLDHGGPDTDDNIQGLCHPCHKIKSAAEGTGWRGADNHPEWLKPSAILLTIVCGPPCSGKTTYVAAHASPADTVIDLDEIALRLDPAYRQWGGGLSGRGLDKVIRTRNAMLGSLDRATHGSAWFIVSAPSHLERNWWLATLGGQLVLLHPGKDECKRRALQRGTPEAAKGVEDWERRSRSPWARKPTPVKRKTIGLDGWPE